jgi:hypothetical protein
MKRRPILERLMGRIVVTSTGCWEYPTLNESGYGVIGSGGRGGATMRTHRVAYEAHVGPIPDGLQLDHLCRNRACCNPAHLEPVTPTTNIRRGDRKTAQTHCSQGHEFTPDNTRDTARQRVCRTCERARGRDYQRRIRAERKAAA